MLFRYRSPDHCRSRSRAVSLASLLGAAGIVAVAPWTVHAAVLDFSAALQPLPAGTIVHSVTLADGATMNVTAEHPEDGPNICILFDSAAPTGGDVDLGTPNKAFGGHGKGEGGEAGKPGQNDVALGKILIIPDNDVDANGDGLVDVPNDEPDGGVVRLAFSHAGRLTFDLVDVDDDEDAPQLLLFKEGEQVGSAEGRSLGDNSLQHIDLSSFGDIDAVEIHLRGSAGIGAIQLDVVTVGVEVRPWSGVKKFYR